VAEKPGFFARRGLEKAKRASGIVGKRTSDIRLPSRKEMAEQEGIKRLASFGKTVVKRTLSSKRK
jgi:hypothetical protein